VTITRAKLYDLSKPETSTMAMQISSDECLSCGTCEPECPTDSISDGLLSYQIDASTCNECEGEADAPQCAEACPVTGCITQA
jgi:ferredoxin